MIERFESGRLRAESFEGYYEQVSRLDALGISIPPEARVLELQAPFAKMAVDVITEVLIPSGYIVADEGRDDLIQLLRRTWQSNDMDSQFNLAAAEAIATGSAFWVLSPPDDEHEYATIRAFDSRHAGVRIDHMGRVLEGVAVYRLDDNIRGASYYTPEGVDFYIESRQGWKRDGGDTYDDWGVSIVPMFNRSRLSDRYGRSDLKELKGVIDAASRTLTNLQVGQEVAAFPLRFLIGDGADAMLARQTMAARQAGEFAPQAANRMENYAGSMLAAPTGADVKQLTGASLDTFTNTYRAYALQISAMTGIPPSMMGVSSDNNPTSAEALRVAKDRLIARAENKQRQFSDALEQVGRIVAAMSGEDLEGLETLEVTWRDAAAPSVSAQMSIAMQAQAQGIIGDQTARDFMRLSPEQEERENQRSEEAAEMAEMIASGRAYEDTPEDEEDPAEEGPDQDRDPENAGEQAEEDTLDAKAKAPVRRK